MRALGDKYTNGSADTLRLVAGRIEKEASPVDQLDCAVEVCPSLQGWTVSFDEQPPCQKGDEPGYSRIELGHPCRR